MPILSSTMFVELHLALGKITGRHSFWCKESISESKIFTGFHEGELIFFQMKKVV
jgi:hypothetical protein